MAMLTHAREQNPTLARTDQAPPPQLGEFLKRFDNFSASEIETLLGAGKYIPQEICNYTRLRDALDVIL
jgi:hypothetical protein